MTSRVNTTRVMTIPRNEVKNFFALPGPLSFPSLPSPSFLSLSSPSFLSPPSGLSFSPLSFLSSPPSSFFPANSLRFSNASAIRSSVWRISSFGAGMSSPPGFGLVVMSSESIDVKRLHGVVHRSVQFTLNAQLWAHPPPEAALFRRNLCLPTTSRVCCYHHRTSLRCGDHCPVAESSAGRFQSATGLARFKR